MQTNALSLDKSLNAALANPNAGLIELDRIECAESLVRFVELAWHVVEPSTPLTKGWHLDAKADHLEAVTRGELTRLIINEPPGTMKSLLVSVFWQAWEWGPKRLTSNRYIGTSYRERLATRDSTRTRRLIESDWFQERWPVQLTTDQNAKTKFENIDTGWRAAQGFESLTGDRADRVLIDDPLSVAQGKSEKALLNAEEQFLEALPTRLNDPENSAIVMIMQRLHEKDPSGLALERGLGYTHLMLPMEFEPERKCYTTVRPRGFDGAPKPGRYDAQKQIWYFAGDDVPEQRKEFVEAAPTQMVYPHDRRTEDGELLFPERFPRKVVDDLKKSLGAMAHAGQDQQRPAPREGGLFKRSDFKRVTREAMPEVLYWVRGWDLAATESPDAAQTSGVKIGETADRHFVIAHCIRERLGPNDVRKLIKATAEDDGKMVRISIPQDPGQAGKSQVFDFVTMLAGYTATATPESGDKVIRASPLAAQVEAGNVSLVEGPWVEGFLDEVCMFPNGKFKDAVDASSRAFNDLVSIPRSFQSQASVR